MTTITIPEKGKKSNKLVAIPRREYEAFLRFQKKEKINPALEEALEDIKKGRLLGPFKSAEEGIGALSIAK